VALGSRGVHLVARGDGKKMSAFVSMLESMLAAQAKSAAEQKQRILADASTEKGPSAEDFSIVVGAHTLAHLAKVFHPKVENDQLRFDLMTDSPNLMVVVGAVGVLSAVAIPAFMKYMRKSKTTEATAGMKHVYDGARAYYLEHGKMPKPIATTPPLGACCGQPEGECAAGSIDWKAWKDLGFSVDGASRYSYELDANATGFTARAIGDLDCDGVYSTFELAAAVSPDGVVKGAAGIYKENELE
jgi:type II secretory pathway pseudopilin PulG